MQLRPELALLALLTLACETPPASTAPARPTPLASASASPSVAPAASASSAPEARLAIKAIPLPGALAPASLDYIAYEGSRGEGYSRVWVPVGATGSVDVLDVTTGVFTRVDGFQTAEQQVHGKKRIRGPSSVTIGELFAYVGDRATNEICPVERKTLKRFPCLKLRDDIDGLVYVAATREVWVTTPEAKALSVLDAPSTGTLAVKGTVMVGGEPEGYAVDESHALLLTNLEDKGDTVVIDVKKRAVTATWSPGCGPEGPRGVAVDEVQRIVLVACTDHIQALDAAANGALLGKLETGLGVDNIDFASATRRLYVAAGKAGRLTVAQVGDHGSFSVITTVATREGARNAVADVNGNAYIGDSAGASLLVVAAPVP